ncbi:rhomboid family intramembrane serine protease [Marinobacterium sp. D7]|uniref:rhomboid family intramembrane serine protease n=1 Tax=Marinobacterium ramblicola TaxID=2849041 RepID=UPI001C2DEC17|nr:rhomboid family intramembrane serine protease [Marinobacterium ramblicola]MBV1788231.1 rhomboid family intramembrane serine protease [Marinobacterium ramblicola]
MIIVPTEKRLEWRNTPFVLILILLVNLLVFFLYQSGDGAKGDEAVTGFAESRYIDKELPIYQRYLELEGRDDDLAALQQANEAGDPYSIAQQMLMDHGYYHHISSKAPFIFEPDLYQRWQAERQPFQDTFDSISSFAYGLRATEVSFVTLISHQFLHGGFDHIFGNMLFLLLFGFAVEAAIGHLRFLLFYLIGGAGAGLTQVLFSLGSDTPLIGASGAISAVMAMYLAIFRLKRIEFFYWVLFFVGYFRAPALLILPLYIGKEVYQYLSIEGSNVAYMAHAGGFVAGALLIGLAMLFGRNAVDEAYVEQEQGPSQRNKGLAEVYRTIEALRFDEAIKQLVALVERVGNDFELARVRYNLEKIKRGEQFVPSFCALMTQKNLSAAQVGDLNQVWQEEARAQDLLPEQDQLELAFRFTTLEDLKGAADIADHLYVQGFKPSEVLLLSQRLATRYAELGDKNNAMKYQQYAQQLTKDGHNGVM